MPLGYQTKQQQIAISGVADLSIRSLLDRQQYFDPDGHAEHLGISSAAWPMFGLLWPSGMQLAARMALRPLTANERVLEVGCGLALASLAQITGDVALTVRYWTAFGWCLQLLLILTQGKILREPPISGTAEP